MITLNTKKWELVYFTTDHALCKKYRIFLHAISDECGIFPQFPISIIESGGPGNEVYKVTYPDMVTRHYVSLFDMANDHNSAIERFETLEDYN